ncbi:hypothetical protein EB837_24150 [Kluyvera ascorbata]|uniref:Uncharacterized protein n=1 Tax=Kluyvera ascorbata TaxID=51288 RepID=A0A3N2RQS5_9ENTR|nr:hypothetical protein [Kluyvera ascorbata]ROU09711.1 hypothetical protein EB837_24150 [Kluyvera ascorbata]
MGLFDKKISLSGMKDKLTDSAASLTESIRSTDVKGTFESLKVTASTVSAATTKIASETYDSGKEKAVNAYDAASHEIKHFNYSNLSSKNFYQEKFSEYAALGAEKVNSAWRSTFEVDKETLQIVEEVRRTLPVPAKTIDDIFEQCRNEALRRAIAAFALGGIMQKLDEHSADKYSNLSENYTQFRKRSGSKMTDDVNFSDMKDERYRAQQQWTPLEDGYHRASPLDPFSADIEHVVAKKELYDDWLIRLGTTDDQFYSAINASENLVFAESSLNSSMQARNIHDYLKERGRPDADNPNLIHVDIVQKDGLVKTVTVDKNDVDEAYLRAKQKQHEHQRNALKEIGTTVAVTGATMAAQQIIGLIVMETIDIFVDELSDIARKGKIINNDGWLKNIQQRTDNISSRLAERFEERDLWNQARKTGIESGVAGALSVIPQILISLIIKLPGFILALIRECTLSTVRCAKILVGNDENKYDHIKIILAGTASAIVGIYVGRVIGNAIAAVPVLNQFNRQVTDVLTGLMVTAVPLVAIYSFEQNKDKLTFKLGTFWQKKNG